MNWVFATICLAAFLNFATAPFSFFLYKHSRRRSELLFGILKVLTGFYCLFGAWSAFAPSAAEGVPFLRGQIFFAQMLLIGIILYAREVTDVRWSRGLSWTFGATMLGIPLMASGAGIDPVDLVSAATRWSGGPIRHSPPSLTLQLFGVAAILMLLLLARAFASAKPRVEARTLSAAVGLMAFGWFFDLVARTLAWSTPAISEYLIALAILGLGNVIMHRFIQENDELRVRTEQLASKNDRLSALQQQLVRREQLATVGVLSAVIAQEVRAPLTQIRHAVEELRGQTLTEVERSAWLESLDEENDRLNRLVGDLLLYAKPVDPQFEQVHLADVLDEAFGKLDAGDAISLAVDLDAVPDHVEADRRLLAMAFAQIARNAVEAMPLGGELRVAGELRGQGDDTRIAIRFADTGEGMDTLVRSRARDPFFSTRASGTGLGLAIVERLVAVHSGRIEIGSHQDDGTTVTVFLPLRREGRLSDPGRTSNMPIPASS